jgi:SAM-dependent methyltransferase
MSQDSADLDRLVETYRIDTVWEQYKRLEFVEKLGAYVDLPGAAALELGSAEGHLTDLLAQRCRRVVAVDGAARFLALARKRVSRSDVVFVHSLFETLSLDERFDVIVMHHVLEHVREPVPLMKHIAQYLAPSGVLAVSVPNAHALSRQLAVKMGLLDSLYSLTENDRHHGHCRVYDWKSVEADAASAGFAPVGRHGLALKLFADFQTEKAIALGIIGDVQLRGLWPLADDYKAVAGAIMLVLAQQGRK